MVYTVAGNGGLDLQKTSNTALKRKLFYIKEEMCSKGLHHISASNEKLTSLCSNTEVARREHLLKRNK